MTYNPNVPASGQSLGETRVPIQTNFTNLNTAFLANHSPLTTNTDGKHKFVQLPESGAGWDNNSTPPTTATNEGALYTKVGTNPAENTLFFRAESNGFEYQITKVDDAHTGTFSTATNYNGTNTGGWTFLPGGMILMYGITTGSGSYDIVFPFSFPTSDPPFSITATIAASAPRTFSISTGTPATDSGFRIQVSGSAASSCHWQAIGN